MGQLLFIKINLFKLFDCKWHLLKRVVLQLKKTFFHFQFVNQQSLRLHKKKSNGRKHIFMLLLPMKKAFDIFDIFFILFKNQEFFFLTSFFVNSFILIIISKISKLQSSSILWSIMSLLNLTNGWWHFKKIECKDLSFSSIKATPYSQSIKEDITKKIFNLQSNIKDIIYGFFFFVFFQNENKRIKNATRFFLMLEVKQINSRITLESFSNKFLKVEYPFFLSISNSQIW